MNAVVKKTVGIVGARGHTGAELIRLVDAHPGLELAFVSSRELDGQAVSTHVDGYAGSLRYGNYGPDAVAGQRADAVVLALPNDKGGAFVEALQAQAPGTVIIDLSADHRFDPQWAYGLPERGRGPIRGATRIANPGCYATAMQVAIAPLLDPLAGPPPCFGVSGSSGAGTTPSDRNNPGLLRDNLRPYALANHIHEREVTAHLGVPVEFMPHVAPHFRGITMTVNLWLREPMEREAVERLYRRHYAGEPLVEVVEDAPWVSRIAGRHGVQVGGFTIAPGGRRVVVVATLDNLLKGAATQAMQNLNLALGFDEFTSIPLDKAGEQAHV